MVLNLAMQAEFMALDVLSKNTDVVIRSTDKGGAIVVLDSGLYIKLNQELLDDINTYKCLFSDPTKVFSPQINMFITGGSNHGSYYYKNVRGAICGSPSSSFTHYLRSIKGFSPLLYARL